MDRRQRKTRTAIFNAFIQLLEKKEFNQITVGEIIKLADVGRATFYAHFETKDYLLRSLCEELFCHIFDSSSGNNLHKHIFDCNAPSPIFLHLFQHLKNNDNNILQLLSCENNALFLQYFKTELIKLLESVDLNLSAPENVPSDFYFNHICATFIETVLWWVKNEIQLPPETIYTYFLAVLNLEKSYNDKSFLL